VSDILVQKMEEIRYTVKNFLQSLWRCRKFLLPLQLTMKDLVGIIILVVSLLLSCTDGERMRRELAGLQALNQADSLLTNDSLALALCDYFDRHGTANEQMLAHYLLGRTYADQGEAPKALEEFHQAAERSDTTAKDCDYGLLTRIHLQTADLFYYQALYSYQLTELLKASHYAKLAGDTVLSIHSYGKRASAFNQMNITDSTIAIRLKTAEEYMRLGYINYAAMYYGALVSPMTESKQYDLAWKYQNIYETYSGFFNEKGDIVKGREVYYYMKGLYFLETGRLDSADYFFRKEKRTGLDLNNQLSASKGLMQLYQKQYNPDSLAKYAEIYCSLNDSLIKGHETDNIQRLQQLYNYERSQTIASQKSKEAAEAKSIIWICLATITILLFTTYVYVIHVRKSREREHRLYLHHIELLEQYKADVENLEAEKNGQLKQVIAEAKKTIANLTEKIRQYEAKTTNVKNKQIDAKLKDTAIYRRFKYLETHTIESPQSEDWESLENVFDSLFPSFRETLESGHSSINSKEFRLCMLIRLHFPSGVIANLINTTKSNVSMMRSRLLYKIYGIEGTAREFDERIRTIS